MGMLRDLVAQLKRIWLGSTPWVRTIYGASAATCIALLLAVGWWSSRPQFIALAHNLAPETTSEIISRLDAARIPYQLNFSGSVVLVPKTRFNEAKLQMGGLVAPAQSASEEETNTILGDPADADYRRQKNRETSLARTIEKMNAVAAATVLLGQAEQSPFLVERKPGRASVMLTLKPGIPFGRNDATAIARLVANSVEGVALEAVSITDTNGQTWYGEGTDELGGDSHLEYQRRFEQRLEDSAMEHLTALLGPGHAVVSVQATMDFTRKESEIIEYDPEGRVAKKEVTDIEESKDRQSTPGGVVGASANAAATSRGGSTTQGHGSETKNEKLEKEYLVGEKRDKVVEQPGRVELLSVAATVDIPPPAEGETAVLDQTKVEDLIKRAVGFDETRDKMSVVIGPLPGATQLTTSVMVTEKWEMYNSLARSASLGIASLVALFFGMKTFRRVREAVRPAPEETKVSTERLRVVSEFAQRARENPEAMKAVITAWLSQTDEGQETGTVRKAA